MEFFLKSVGVIAVAGLAAACGFNYLNPLRLSGSISAASTLSVGLGTAYATWKVGLYCMARKLDLQLTRRLRDEAYEADAFALIIGSNKDLVKGAIYLLNTFETFDNFAKSYSSTRDHMVVETPKEFSTHPSHEERIERIKKMQ